MMFLLGFLVGVSIGTLFGIRLNYHYQRKVYGNETGHDKSTSRASEEVRQHYQSAVRYACRERDKRTSTDSNKQKSGILAARKIIVLEQDRYSKEVL